MLTPFSRLIIDWVCNFSRLLEDSLLGIISGWSGVSWITRSASMWVGAEVPATGYVFVDWVRVVRGGRGLCE